MPKIQKEITIMNAQGLHARPAAIFVQIASKFNSSVSVKKADEKVNGKSIMGILILAAERYSKVTIEAEGDDAAEAVIELERFLNQNE